MYSYKDHPTFLNNAKLLKISCVLFTLMIIFLLFFYNPSFESSPLIAQSIPPMNCSIEYCHKKFPCNPLDNIPQTRSSFPSPNLETQRTLSHPPSTSSSRDVIIGLAAGLELIWVSAFVQSFRRYSPQARLVLFVDKESLTRYQSLNLLFQQFNVESVIFSQNSLEPAYIRSFHPSSYRWFLIRDWLQQHYSELDHIAMMDVRDVVFQKDIFSYFSHSSQVFYAFYEALPKTIHQCDWNRGWVKDCFGQDILNQVSQKIITCSGVSMGTTTEVVEYVNKMVDNLIQRKNCERNGVDQGMHNVLVHTNQIPNLSIISNEHGPIGIVQSMRHFKINHFSQLLNDDGEIYYAVHQYDRQRRLQDIFHRQYPINNHDTKW